MTATKQRIDRIGVVGRVYHQVSNEQPTSKEIRFDRRTEAENPPYVRRYILEQEWKPLDLGPHQRIGRILIENLEGRDIKVYLTPEQKKELEAKIIETGLTLDGNSIIPGPIVRPADKISEDNAEHFEPHESVQIMLRARTGQVIALVTLYGG